MNVIRTSQTIMPSRHPVATRLLQSALLAAGKTANVRSTLHALLIVLLVSAVTPWAAAQNTSSTVSACIVNFCFTSPQAQQQYEKEHGCTVGSKNTAPVCLIAQGVCGQEQVGAYGLPQIEQRLEKVVAALDDPKQAATCANKTSGLEQIVNEMTNAFVSGDVYSNAPKKNTLPSYIRRISNNDTAELATLGLTPKDLQDTASTFFASVYYNDRTKQYIVANRGTDFSQALNPFAKDNSVITDVRQALGYGTDQYDQNAWNLASKITKKNVVFTGHSLGGGLAALEATITGGTAMTFDAAGASNLVTTPMLRYIAWYAGVDYNQGINAVLPTALGSQSAIPLTTWDAGTTTPPAPNEIGWPPPTSQPGTTNSEQVVQPQTGTCLGDIKHEAAYHMMDPLLHGLNFQLTQLLCH